MAKRKNSTALFEVMRAAQQKALERQGISLQGGATQSGNAQGGASQSSHPQSGHTQGGHTQSSSPPTSSARSSSEGHTSATAAGRSYAPPPGHSQLKPLGTPAIFTVTRKWFAALMEKRAGSTATSDESAPPALDPTDPTAGITAVTLASRSARQSVSTPAPAIAPNPEQVFVDESQDDEAPPVPTLRQAVPRATAASRGGAGSSSQVAGLSVTRSENDSSPKPGNQVAIDRDRQEVTLKVRFQTVAIGVVATLVVVGLAYIAGKKTGAPTARVPSTPEIKSGPVQPGVLDPRGTKAVPGGDARMAAERIPGSAMAGASPSVNGSTTVRAGDAVFVDSPVVNGLSKRDPGLNYCVIESYGPSQQQWALDVRDFLNGAGIPCTIEIGRPNLRTRSGDYLIVGTRGFAPRYGNAAAYKSYIESIEQASVAFPDKSKFHQPQMMMVKWIDE
ncbi:hypothetical protein [Humisphaera borealis]|uniref:Uncharacterized protein n=1 Tax=Humisphaera borealis TaxID=2807512 RepID=A0A7M2WY60_9BACT|nr:hypothetical protein [Humisphaera borealis]QOV90457.1 hypothetical protein IPV69_03560 [Humisphaera borealis]